MIEKRSYKIDNRIFTLKDIRKIASIFEQEHKNATKNKHDSSLSFSVNCVDGSEYETEDVKLFDENAIITKRVENIKFNFIENKDYFKEDKSISLQLKNGNDSYGNELQISGTDSNWVNGSLIKLKEVIEASQPQFNLVHKFGLPLTIISSISIGTIFLLVLVLVSRAIVFKPFINPFKLMSDEPIIFIPSIFTMGFFPSLFVVDWLKKMFPSIEIQIGPDHTFIEANRRNIFYGIITLVLLPIILTLIFK